MTAAAAATTTTTTTTTPTSPTPPTSTSFQLHSNYGFVRNLRAFVVVVAIVIAVVAVCGQLVLLPPAVTAAPMLYKKNTQDKYEADLVPVSSTVIPLSVLEVSYGLGGKPSEEYKQAYLKKLRKKVVQQQQHQHQRATNAGSAEGAAVEDVTNADTLITVKSQQHDGSKAKVKGINN